jgi:hypothetical protein
MLTHDGAVRWILRSLYAFQVCMRVHAHLLADIANYIYEHPSALALALQGIWISDRPSPTSRPIPLS